MRIGIPKEIKNREYRVGATPTLVRALINNNHQVFVQEDAGSKIGFYNDDYSAAGAVITNVEEVWACDMIVKVKEPQPEEFDYLKPGQILFCYLHLSVAPKLTQKLIEKKIIAIAYETVVDNNGKLPLLVPMSEIAGRIAVQVGAWTLQMNNEGRGVLLSGVPGVPAGNVVVIGAGSAGTEAARMALGIGANTTILDINLNRLRQLDLLFGPRLQTAYSSPDTIEKALSTADLVIAVVLIPGKLAPKLISRKMLAAMPKRAVIVDISIDQGGCCETSRPTSHDSPTYIVDDIIHYCVTNMPGACARTATLALTHATERYVLMLANRGIKEALLNNAGLLTGLNVCNGHVTYQYVAQDLGYIYVEPRQAL